MNRFSLLQMSLISILILLFTLPVTAQDTWQLNLQSVRVDQQREDSGDRPYFAMITFQSRVNVRRSTRVELYEREPHDWVSKREYQAGRRLLRGDHMSSGESLPIPNWMGVHVYEPINMTSIAGGTALAAPVIGAFIVALDNNNTPPHVIRNALEIMRGWTEQYMRENVETGAIIGALRSGSIQESIESFMQEAMQDLDVGAIIETAAQITVGSTFNPDKIVGVHALVFPAIEEVVPEDATGMFSAPLVGEQVRWNYTIARPDASFRRTLLFQGSGARYSVPVRFTNARVPDTAPVYRLVLRIRTGDDDLREGSRVHATALDASGAVLGEADLNSGARWADRTEHTVSLPLGSSVMLEDIASVRIQFTSGGGMSGDNWNMDMITVYTSTAAPALVSMQGRPLKRFTGDDRTYEIPLR